MIIFELSVFPPRNFLVEVTVPWYVTLVFLKDPYMFFDSNLKGYRNCIWGINSNMWQWLSYLGPIITCQCIKPFVTQKCMHFAQITVPVNQLNRRHIELRYYNLSVWYYRQCMYSLHKTNSHPQLKIPCISVFLIAFFC